MACEHCGADAVSADGVCQRCGWRVALGPYVRGGSATSLSAETRAADIPPGNPPAYGPRSHVRSAPFVAGPSVLAPRSTPLSPRAQFATGRIPEGPPSGGFCGTCGGPIEPDQQFCGQCGAPVPGNGGPGADQGTVMRRTPSGDDAFGDLGESDPWSPNEFDAPTEEYSRMMGTSPGGYVAGGYPRPGGFATPPPADGSAEMRVVVGILCVLGGLLSGAGALIVALWPR
jgi:hypothetical protein